MERFFVPDSVTNYPAYCKKKRLYVQEIVARDEENRFVGNGEDEPMEGRNGSDWNLY